MKVEFQIIPRRKLFILQNTSEFIKEYLEEAAKSNNPPSQFYAPLTYDAVWSMALALNSSASRLLKHETLQNFTYERKDMTQIFMEQMHSLNFEGMTVRFNPRLWFIHTKLDRCNIFKIPLTISPPRAILQ